MVSGLFLFSCNSSSTSQSAQEEEHVVVDSTIDNIHTSKNSLDWAGNYKGELPCKDCDAIEMEVTINQDNTFWVKTTMKGKDEVIEDQGEIAWESNGSYIHLKGSQVDYHFRVGENHLTFLVEPGKLPDDSTLTDYTLEKVQEFPTP